MLVIHVTVYVKLSILDNRKHIIYRSCSIHNDLSQEFLSHLVGIRIKSKYNFDNRIVRIRCKNYDIFRRFSRKLIVDVSINDDVCNICYVDEFLEKFIKIKIQQNNYIIIDNDIEIRLMDIDSFMNEFIYNGFRSMIYNFLNIPILIPDNINDTYLFHDEAGILISKYINRKFVAYDYEITDKFILLFDSITYEKKQLFIKLNEYKQLCIYFNNRRRAEPNINKIGLYLIGTLCIYITRKLYNKIEEFIQSCVGE